MYGGVLITEPPRSVGESLVVLSVCIGCGASDYVRRSVLIIDAMA